MTFIVTEREIDGQLSLVITPGAGSSMRELWWRWTGLPIMSAALHVIAKGVVEPKDAARYAEATLATVTSERVMGLLCPHLTSDAQPDRAPAHGLPPARKDR